MNEITNQRAFEVVADELASRGKRWLAAFIDSLIIIVIAFALMFALIGLGNDPEAMKENGALTIIWPIILLVTFFAINWRHLSKSGQTIGKRILGIRVITLTGEVPNVWSHIFRRYLIFWGIPLIPVIGEAIGFIGILLIFGSQRRCLHDYVAGTKVIKANNELQPTQETCG